MIIFAAVNLRGEVQPQAPEGLLKGTYVLNQTFSDEFENGFNASKWYDFYPTWNGRDGMFFFDRKNVSVKDGKLVLAARAEDSEKATPELKYEGKDKFSTAAVRSKTRICYGFFESKFKVMNAQVCNAFWLNDPVDPPKKYRPGNRIEEIDIFEIFGKCDSASDMHKVFAMNTHMGATPYIESKVWLEHASVGYKLPVNTNFAAEYHTAGFLWTPEKLVWLLDGKVVYELENKFFHRPLYLNFDCEVMKWVGFPDSADLPAEYSVEYVRVWQLKK